MSWSDSRGGWESKTSMPVWMTGGERRYCSIRISAYVLRYVSVAAAVGAPTGRRLRGGCIVGSLGVGIQWWTTCPDSMASAQWKKEAGRGTGVPRIPFWESSMYHVNPASRVAGRLTNKYRPWRCWLRGE